MISVFSDLVHITKKPEQFKLNIGLFGERRKYKFGAASRQELDQIFFVRSRRIRVDLLSYERKTTDKRQQNDWRAKKNLDGK